MPIAAAPADLPIDTALSHPVGRRIAIIDDDPTDATQLRLWLEQDGALTETFVNAKSYLQAEGHAFDLLLLDWHLPDLSGIELIRQLRAKKIVTPVIFVTVRSTEVDIVTAFDAGADDYLIKPLRRAETLARVVAMLRRSDRERPPTPFTVGEYTIDPNSQSVSWRNRTETLRNREFKLAQLLFQSPNRVVSRVQIATVLSAYGPLDSSRSVDTQVYRLRKKLELSADTGVMLQTVYSVGYRLVLLDKQ